MNAEPTGTFDKLCSEIIGPLLSQICQSNLNYCVKKKIGGVSTRIALGRKYEEYRGRALEKMQSGRLDRHKWASCICGAIVETRPLEGYKGAAILKKANEIFALRVGLNTIKMCMVYDLAENGHITEKEKIALKEYLRCNFEMKFPDTIRDTQKYSENFENALYWSHSMCTPLGKECFKYDIWSYAKLFYHLEMYNQSFLQQCYQKYKQMQN